MQVSIIITCYNYAQYMDQCIRSCINQEGFHDFEIIIVDDGSEDESVSIAKKYLDKVKVYSNKNHGVEYSSNYGIKKSSGEFVVRLDADDLLMPDYLKNTVKHIKSSTCAFVYTEYEEIDPEGRMLKQVELPDFDTNEIKQRGDFLATGTLYEKFVLEDVGFYSEQVRNCGLEHFELILKLLHYGYVGKCLHKPLFCYRRHSKNMSSMGRDNILSYGKLLAEKYKLGKYTTNKNHPY